MKKTILLSFMMASLMLCAQNTIYVSTTGSDTGTGTNVDPYQTLSKALKMVGTGTTVVYLTAGTYMETVTDTLNSVSSIVTIRGENAKTTIIEQTTAGKRILVNGTAHRGSNNSLTIQDLTFKGGSFTGGGGAAINYQETAGFKNDLTLNRVIFEGNTVTTSGALTQNGGALTFAGNNLNVNNCYFKNNTVVSGAAATGNGLTSAGGAIYITNSAAVGTVYHDGVFVSINNTTFDGNSAVSKGGAILASNSSNRNVTAPNSYVKCTNCTFVNNKATKNPITSTETDIITGSAFSASTSTNSVTMIYDFVFTNCTFTNNKGGSADGSGSVYESKATIDIDGTRWATATLVNNIINTPATANCGAALVVNAASATKFSGTNNIIESIWTARITDPVLTTTAAANSNLIGSNATNLNTTLTDNSTASVYKVPYLELTAGSTAIDAGTSNFGSPEIVPSTDIRGAGMAGSGKDCGAYEFNGIVTLGYSQIDKNNTFSIYPNPVISSIYIEGIDVQNVDIYSVSGKKLQSFSNIQNEINVAGFESGLYLINIKTVDKTYMQTFIKK